MRVKKHAIRITALASVVSIVFAFVIYPHGQSGSLLSFISNALLGIFASSVATLLVFIYEYRAERSAAIESFCRIVFDVAGILDQIVYVNPSTGGTSIDNRYLERHGKQNTIEEICEKYVAIVSKRQDLNDALRRIDFFLDWPIAEWHEAHHLKWTVDKSKLTKKERKEAIEKAKAIYWEEQYSGKRKKRLEKEIFIPLRDMIASISPYALNCFRWYLAGHNEHEEEVVRAVLDLQNKVLFNGTEKKNHPWYTAACKLDCIRVGSRSFWLNE